MGVLPARRAVGGGSFSKRPLVTVTAFSNRSQQSNRVEYARLDKDILLKSRHSSGKSMMYNIVQRDLPVVAVSILLLPY